MEYFDPKTSEHIIPYVIGLSVSATYDDSVPYRRQDEIGTPYCVTVDVQTVEEDNAVTIRDRDTMTQERVSLDQVKSYLRDKLDL
jgi:glycyl-tRNA synthetase (class II)